MNRVGSSRDNADDSITAHENSHVNVNRFMLPKDARDLIIAGVMATSIAVNVMLWSSYESSQRTVEKAYTDIKTQVWVRQDKDEERFEKFVAGPYAQLTGKTEASLILFSKCKESK